MLPILQLLSTGMFGTSNPAAGLGVSSGILNNVLQGRGALSPYGDGRRNAENDPRVIRASAPAPVQSAQAPLVNPMDMPEFAPPLPSPIEVAMAPEPSPALANESAAPAVSASPAALPMPTPDMGQQEQPGILSRLFDNSRTGVSPFEYAMRALGAAGSQDPIKTAQQFAAQDSENARLQQARRLAMQPKVIGNAANGAVQIVQMPDGSIRTMTLEQVAQMNRENKSLDFQQDVAKAVAVEEAKDRIKAGQEQRKSDRESATERVQAGLSVQELNSIADALEKTDKATGPALGLLPKKVRDVFFPEGSSFQDRAERVVQAGLRATLGSQYTQVEGENFLARAYNPRLSEQQNAQNLRNIARELAAMQLDKDSAQSYFKQNGTLEGFVPKGTADAAIKTQATAAFGSYEPDKYEYGVNPATGKFARRPKGQ